MPWVDGKYVIPDDRWAKLRATQPATTPPSPTVQPGTQPVQTLVDRANGPTLAEQLRAAIVNASAAKQATLAPTSQAGMRLQQMPQINDISPMPSAATPVVGGFSGKSVGTPTPPKPPQVIPQSGAASSTIMLERALNATNEPGSGMTDAEFARAFPQQAFTPPFTAAGLPLAAYQQRQAQALGKEVPPMSAPAKVLTSLAAGVGDVRGAVGGAARWLGQKTGAEGVEEWGAKQAEGGKKTGERYSLPTEEFTWKRLLDPDFYLTNVVRSLPFALSFIPAAAAGSAVAGAAATGLALSPFWATAMGAVGAGSINRAIESAMEAGGAYNEALERGMTAEQADKAADSVFKDNLKLVGLDIGEFATSFVPVGGIVGKVGKSALGRAAIGAGRLATTGAQEAMEEGLQEYAQAKALGDTKGTFGEFAKTPQAQEAMATGGVFGMGMGLGGSAYNAAKEFKARVIDGLPADMKADVDRATAAMEQKGIDRTVAQEVVLNQAMESSPEAKEIIERKTREVVAEFASREETQTAESVAQTPAPTAEQPAPAEGPVSARPVASQPLATTPVASQQAPVGERQPAAPAPAPTQPVSTPPASFAAGSKIQTASGKVLEVVALHPSRPSLKVRDPQNAARGEWWIGSNGVKPVEGAVQSVSAVEPAAEVAPAAPTTPPVAEASTEAAPTTARKAEDTPTAKEPWQMTTAEFVADVQADYDKADQAYQALNDKYVPNVDYRKRTWSEGGEPKVDFGTADVLFEGTNDLMNDPKYRKLGAARRKAQSSLRAAQNKHRTAVERAARQGKAIPAEVLADYPDVQVKPKAQTPPPVKPPTTTVATGMAEPSGESPRIAEVRERVAFYEQRLADADKATKRGTKAAREAATNRYLHIRKERDGWRDVLQTVIAESQPVPTPQSEIAAGQAEGAAEPEQVTRVSGKYTWDEAEDDAPDFSYRISDYDDGYEQWRIRKVETRDREQMNYRKQSLRGRPTPTHVLEQRVVALDANGNVSPRSLERPSATWRVDRFTDKPTDAIEAMFERQGVEPVSERVLAYKQEYDARKAAEKRAEAEAKEAKRLKRAIGESVDKPAAPKKVAGKINPASINAAHKTVQGTRGNQFREARVIGGKMYSVTGDQSVAVTSDSDLSDGVYALKGTEWVATENFRPRSGESEAIAKRFAASQDNGAADLDDSTVQAFAKALKYSSNEDISPVLKAVALEVKDGKARVLATDGYRISYQNVAQKLGVADGTYLVPQTAVRLMLRDKGDIRMSVGKDRITFDNGKYQVQAMLVDGTFPNVDAVWPKEFQWVFVVNRSDLASAAAEFQRVSDKDTGRTIIFRANENGYTLTNDSGSMRERNLVKSFDLAASRQNTPTDSSDTPQGELILPIRMDDGEAGEFAMDLRYLADALENIPQGDGVAFGMTGGASPFVMAAQPPSKASTLTVPKRTVSLEPPNIDKTAMALHKMAVNTRTTLPVLTAAHVGKGIITTTDREITVRSKTTLPDGIYQLIGDRLEMSGFPMREYPQIRPVEGKVGQATGIRFPREAFARAVRAVAKDDTRPVLTTVLMRVQDGKLTLEGTDGFMLARSSVPAPKGLPDGQWLVPQSAVKALLKLNPAEVSIRIDDEAILFESNGIEVQSRLVDGEYPDTDAVFPKATTETVAVPVKDLRAAIRRLKPFIDAKRTRYGTPAEGEDAMRVSFGRDNLTLSTVDGRKSAVIPVQSNPGGSVQGVSATAILSHADPNKVTFSMWADTAEAATGDTVYIGPSGVATMTREKTGTIHVFTDTKPSLSSTTSRLAEEVNKRIGDVEPPMGGSLRVESRPVAEEDATAGAPSTPPKGKGFAFADPEIERIYQQTHGLKPETLLERVKASANEFWRKATREYEHLPRTAEFQKLRYALNQLGKQKGVQSGVTVQTLRDMLHPIIRDREAFNLFERKVLLDDLIEEASQGHDLPNGFDADTARSELARVNTALTPELRKVLADRKALWDELKDEYISAMKAIGFDTAGRFTRENYFRHQVLEHAAMRSVTGTGRKVRTPTGRGFLKQREGGSYLMNTNYLEAEHEVMAQMRYDIEVAKVIKMVDEEYNIVRDVKTLAKEKGAEDWRTEIPKGYALWQPREGNNFYMANSIAERLAREIADGTLQAAGLTPDQVKQVIVLGGPRTEFVVKQEIADTLENMTKPITPGPAAQLVRKAISGWKEYQLISPMRFLKYNFRNLTGDAEAAWLGNPDGFRKVPQAVRELYGYYRGKSPTGSLQEFIERGGMESTLQVAELQDINELKVFAEMLEPAKRSLPRKAWDRYWRGMRMATDFREGILRYANYLSFREQMQKNGRPTAWGASDPDLVMALDSIEDRAFMLSNQLLGAYDEVSVKTQDVRNNLLPFFSWQEVNARRYVQLMKNVNLDAKATTELGKKVTIGLKRTPFLVLKAGMFVARAGAVWAMLSAYNHSRFPEEEADLPADIRRSPHIVLGRDEDGKVKYFSRLGIVEDFLEWFMDDKSKRAAADWLNGRTSAWEAARQLARSTFTLSAAANKLIQAGGPVKTAIEAGVGKSYYPNIAEPSTIRNKAQFLARSVGLGGLYDAVAGLPQRSWTDILENMVYYKSDPGESAYWEVKDEVREFQEKIGKASYSGGSYSPRSNALYNFRLALRYGDKKAAVKYGQEYYALGGTDNGLATSLSNMDPLQGLTQEEMAAFVAWYAKKVGNADAKRRLTQAYTFFADVLTGERIKEREAVGSKQ